MEPQSLSLAPPNAVSATPSRKRKREDEKVVLGDPFVIGPNSSSIFDSPLKLTPAVALPRSYIPLQWLAGSPSRLFSHPNNLPVLEVPGNILVAKVDGERQLAAVEKIQDGVYTVSKLSTHLKMKDVRKTVSLVKKSPPEPRCPEDADGGGGQLGSEWWSQLSIPNCSVKDLLSDPVASLAMGSPDPENHRNNRLIQAPARLTISPPPDFQIPPDGPGGLVSPTLPDILENTRKQYFTTLYTAKTSLAYFAKSTLSRARVATQNAGSGFSATAPAGELISFLQEMLIPFEKMDVKFRNTILQMALEEPVDEAAILRVGEEEYVHQWRYSAFQDKLVRASDLRLKRKIEELKIRETELQIIILLEIMALQRDQVPPGDVAADINKSKRDKKSAKRKGKNKSKADGPNYPLLLDLLVDRLCIWRSIGSVSGGLEEEASEEKSVMDREHDHLRHFCVEVVLAFYASKLPDECKSINKKCGGRSGSSNAGQPRDKRERRRTAAKKAPALSRSVSALSAPPNTRETSVDTLATLVAADAASVSKASVRGGTLNSKSFAKREVQISSKVVQKKRVDAELKDAIDVLKRPNRVVVAAEIVDDAKKRVTTGLGKKTRKTPRNPLANVQVLATPKRRRTIVPPQQTLTPILEDESGVLPYKDPLPKTSKQKIRCEVAGTPMRPPRNPRVMDDDGVPSTSPYDVPVDDAPRPSLDFSRGMFVTPQKKPRRLMGTDLGAANSILPSTPKPRSMPSRPLRSVAESGAAPTPGSSPDGGVRLFGAICETPVKKVKSMEESGEISIYDSLGWNDYDL